MAALKDVAMEMYERMEQGEAPTMTLPVRTKSNIGFDEKTSVYTYKDKKTIRKGAELGSAKRLLKALHVIEFIEDMIQQGKTSTLREMYYISEGWGHGKFGNQSDSDNLAEDLEIVSKKLREDFRLRPEEDGSRMIGDIQIEELNRRGEWMQINCRNDVGDSGYGIPFNVDDHKLRLVEHNVKFILAIETGGMFDRLVENGFDEEHDALLIHTKGQPARSTRRIIKRMEMEWGVPVLVFADCDPYSFRIFASIAYGAIKTAHISHYLATPSAQYLGITMNDILNHDLPTDDLTPEDRKQLNAELSDPRFADGEWQEEIKLMLEFGKKAEQQSLAKYGLDFVTETYLPEKLAEFGLM
ncbi:MAG: DNA topoisomerase VI [Euryarchaeota archaeon]|nr:DNA topoisomerase VI [Euryarchaeota archaeon]